MLNHRKVVSGMRFGQLVTVERVKAPEGKKGHHYWWSCKCDCGTETIVRNYSLVDGHTRSCGCLARIRMKDLRFKVPPGHAGLTKLINTYRNRARKKQITFSLTRKQVEYLTSGPCYYCGDMPTNCEMRGKSKDDRSRYLYNGLDRLDNTLGYEFDNVVGCCAVCNRMKLAHDVDFFVNHINKMYLHLLDHQKLQE